MPRVIIGSPLFNHADHVREAIESILGQTFSDFAFVLVDDVSSDTTPEIAREYVSGMRGCRTSGMKNALASWTIRARRLRLRRSGIRMPSISRGRAITISGIRAGCNNSSMRSMAVVTCCSRTVEPAHRPDGRVAETQPWVFDTLGVTNRWTRLRSGIREMRAGNMVYGLYRVGSLERAGVYRKVRRARSTAHR